MNQDTDKGFGTGLRRQLERRREGEDASGEAQQEAPPAHIVAEEILADVPVASSEKERRPTSRRSAPSSPWHSRASATSAPRWRSRPRCSSESSPGRRA